MERILVTGSTDGIGLRTAQILAGRGHEVVTHGRVADRVAAARDATGKGAVAAVTADLADLDQVAELAGEARRLGVTALVNNAGVYCRERVVTLDGHEQMWQVNHLAPSLLTALMLPDLAPGSRVVNLSSVIHQRGEIDLADPDFHSRKWHHFKAHAQTKLAAALMAREYARRHPGITFLAVHPGMVGTKLLTQGMKVQGTDSLDEGAATSVFALTQPGLANGSYLAHEAPAQACPNARDDAVAADLFDHTFASLGLTFA